MSAPPNPSHRRHRQRACQRDRHRVGAGVSVEAGSPGRSVRARRHDRHRRPRRLGEGRCRARPDDDRREQGRRRRLGRRDRDRARRARRLFARHGDGLDHRRQPGDQPEAAVQPDHRLHADHQRRGDAERDRGAPELSGARLQGLPRRAEEEPGQVLVLELGNGRHRPPADGAVQEPLGHLRHPHPVPRRRAGAQRHRRRPGADDLRQPAVGAALHQGRAADRDRRRRAAAAGGAAERADLQGGRPRARQPDGLLRHLRAQGTAEGRSSTRSTTRSRRRSTTRR